MQQIRKLQGLKWHVGVSFALKVSQVVFSSITTWLLVRMLGVKAFGLYTYAYTLILLLSVPAQFGLPNLILREVAQGRAQNKWARVKGIIFWAFGVSGVLAFALGVLGGGASWFLSPHIASLDGPTFVLGLLLLPLIVLSQVCGAVLRAFKKVTVGLLVQQTLPPILFSALIALVFTNLSVSSGENGARVAMFLHASAALITVTFGLIFLLRTWPQELKKMQPSYYKKIWLRSVLPFAAIGGLYLVNQNTDILILGLFREPTEVSIYRVAVQMSNLVIIGLQAVDLVIAPRFAELYAQKKPELLKKTAQRGARAALLLAIPAIAILLLAGQSILAFVFGSEYLAAYAPLCILLFGQFVNASTGAVGFLLNMTGHENDTIKSVLIAATINIVLNIILIPFFGMLGAALSTAISACVANILLWLTVRKKLGISSFAF